MANASPALPFANDGSFMQQFMAMQSNEAAATTIAKPPVKYIHPAQVSHRCRGLLLAILRSCIDIFHTYYRLFRLRADPRTLACLTAQL